MEKDFEILTGRAHPVFAEQVAKHLGKTVVDAGVSTFKSGELHAQLAETVRGKEIFVVQPHGGLLSPNEAIFEQGLIAHTAALEEASRITAVSPFFGYGRQDKRAVPRESFGAKFAMGVLEKASNIDRFLTMDPHAGQTEGFCDIPYGKMSAFPVIVKYLMKHYADEIDSGQLTCATADAGRLKLTYRFQEALGLAPLDVVQVVKTRTENVSNGGKVTNETRVEGIIGDIKDKTVVVIDDMIDTAGTACGDADELHEMGPKELIIACTHLILSDEANEKIDKSAFTKVIGTDTLPLIAGASEKIVVVSVERHTANGIRVLLEGRSLSALSEFNSESSLHPLSA